MTDSTLKPAADAVKDAAASATQAAGDAARSVADGAKDAAAAVQDGAADAAKDVGKTAGEALDAGKDAAKDANAAAADAAKGAGAAVSKAGAAVETKAKDVTAATQKKVDKVADAVDDEKAKQPPPQRSVAEIQAELAATRERLAGRIDGLAEYVKPANVMDRQVKKITGVFVDEYGGIKPVPVLAAAGAVVGIVLLIGLGRRRRSS